MAPAVERREHKRRYPSDGSESPIKDHHSPRRRSPPRRERSPARRRSSPRTRSPTRVSSSHRTRSPVKEKLSNRTRSLEQGRPRSPVKSGSSRSPSPRTKRLRRIQAERETEVDREQGRNAGRGEHDKERHRERGEFREVYIDRNSAREKNDGGSSRSSRRDRSTSPEERSHRRRHSSHSPARALKSGACDEVTMSRGAEHLRDGDQDSVAKMKAAEEALQVKEKQKPSFELSGKLAEDTNRVRGITLLFTEPPDARKPDERWRLYVFKAGEVLNEPLYVHRQSCYLFGRERRVADIPTDHPSCSKQHAVLQYRLIEKEQPDGLLSKEVRPYLMDLGSTNGTFINDTRLEPQRYYELFEKDTIKFGNSSREYVLLHENSAGTNA